MSIAPVHKLSEEFHRESSPEGGDSLNSVSAANAKIQAIQKDLLSVNLVLSEEISSKQAKIILKKNPINSLVIIPKFNKRANCVAYKVIRRGTDGLYLKKTFAIAKDGSLSNKKMFFLKADQNKNFSELFQKYRNENLYIIGSAAAEIERPNAQKFFYGVEILLQKIAKKNKHSVSKKPLQPQALIDVSDYIELHKEEWMTEGKSLYVRPQVVNGKKVPALGIHYDHKSGKIFVQLKQKGFPKVGSGGIHTAKFSIEYGTGKIYVTRFLKTKVTEYTPPSQRLQDAFQNSSVCVHETEPVSYAVGDQIQVISTVEYYENGTIQDQLKYLKKHTGLLKGFVALFKGLESLHAQNIALYDIKPANIFIDDNWNFLFGDLDLAEEVPVDSSLQKLKGTQKFYAFAIEMRARELCKKSVKNTEAYVQAFNELKSTISSYDQDLSALAVSLALCISDKIEIALCTLNILQFVDDILGRRLVDVSNDRKITEYGNELEYIFSDQKRREDEF